MYPIASQFQYMSAGEGDKGDTNQNRGGTSGNQQMNNGVMMVMNGNQGVHDGPVYVVQTSDPVQYSPAAGFMQHRSNMMTSHPRLQQLHQLQAYPEPALNSGPEHNYDMTSTMHAFPSRPQASQFNPPPPIVTSPSMSQPMPQYPHQNLNIPTGMVIQASPIQQLSPYDGAAQLSPNSAETSSAPTTEQTSYVITPHVTSSNDQFQQHQPIGYVYRNCHDPETPLSAAFPQHSNVSYDGPLSGNPRQESRVPIQQQQMAPFHQQQVAPQVQFQPAPNYGVQIHPGNPIQYQYQDEQCHPSCPRTSNAVDSALQREPMSTLAHQQQWNQASQASGPIPSSHGQRIALSAPMGPSHAVASNTGPFAIAAQDVPPLSGPYRPMNAPMGNVMQYHQHASGSGWTHHGQSATTEQSSGIPPGFTAAHSGTPGFFRGGLGISAGGGEEEYTSTLTYDPYMVKHRKRTTPEQLVVLEKAFEESAKPSATARKLIAEKIGMNPRSVQVWFQNRRQKKKLLSKKHLDAESLEPSNTQASQTSTSISYQGAYTMRPTPSRLVQNDGRANGEYTFWTDSQQVPRSSTFTAPPISSQSPLDRSALRRSSVSRPHTLAGGTRADKPTSLIGQGRRGSQPYPPRLSPVVPPSTAQYQLSPRIGRTVSPSALARGQMPPHLAKSLSNGRRASLPVNSQWVSLGFFTPPRIGTKATAKLTAIVDDEHLVNQMPVSTDAYPGLQHSSVQSSSQAANGGPGWMSAHPSTGQLHHYGPLPNPEFSFGYDALAGAGPMTTQGSVYRNRMGSMASTLSQATTADGTSDSDWERTQQLITPFMLPNGDQTDMFPGLPADMGQGHPVRYAEAGTEVNNKQLSVPSVNEARRASAPAELLQKFAVLDVEQQSLAGRKKCSPLNMSFTGGTEESESHSGTSATPSPLPCSDIPSHNQTSSSVL